MILFGTIITVALNLTALLFAYFRQSDKMTDLVYSLSFFVVAILLYFNSIQTIPALILTLMICLWALRLGGYLFWRIHKIKKDDRFDKRRVKFSSIMNFFILQTGSILILLIPAIIFYGKPNAVLTSIQFIGMGIWFFGWILETVADYQKAVFKGKSENKGQFISSGVWSIVRYPNYTGEILCWIGVFVFCTPVFISGNWLAIVSPIWIAILLMFISGIPLLEKSYETKYGGQKAFVDYVAGTKRLVPWVY